MDGKSDKMQQAGEITAFLAEIGVDSREIYGLNTIDGVFGPHRKPITRRNKDMQRVGLILVVAGLLTATVWAQEEYVPVGPEAVGLVPKTSTFDLNAWPGDGDPRNNGGSESTGIAIGSGGNILIGWEDDGDGWFDYEAVWVVYKQDGTPIVGSPQSYFTAAGEPVSPEYTWGPKIKANLFGTGFGMGSTAWGLGEVIDEFFDVNTIGGDPGVNAGDYPAVQLIKEDGTPDGLALCGVSDEYAEREGDIRIADWDYLSNGNILIVGESRQKDDLVNIYGGTTPSEHPIFTIVKKDRSFVKKETLVPSAAFEGNMNMWHGAAVTANGFACRWSGPPFGGNLRMFDNDGVATTSDISIAALTGVEATGQGGRGDDNVGFHGNGVDTYVVANRGSDDVYQNGVFVTSVSDLGTLRWTAVATDDMPFAQVSGVDCAVNDAGYVLVVWCDAEQLVLENTILFGRFFNPDGTPKSGSFYISERATPENNIGPCVDPRVTWRNDVIAVDWVDNNNPNMISKTVAVRIFNAPTGTGIDNFMLY